MSRLVNLRHLVGRPDLLSGIQGLGKMIALQELEVRGRKVTEVENMGMLEELTIWDLDEVQSKEEAALARLHLKKHLRVLKLMWVVDRDDRSVNPTLEEGVLEALQPVADVRQLYIEGYGGAKSPEWIVDPSWVSSSSLESVQLKYCMNWEVLPPLSQLPCLKFLDITGMYRVRRMGPDRFFGCGVDGGGGRGFKMQGFPLLEELTLEDIPEWEEWEVPHVDDNQVHTTQPQQQPSFLPRLRTLRIKGCPKLRELPPLPPTLTELMLEEVGVTHIRGQFQSPGAEELDLTSSLQISSCENLSFLTSSSLKRLSIHNDAHLDNEALSRWLRGLTSLKSLSISNCPAITILSVGEAMCGLTTLESLKIKWCEELTSLVGSHATLASLKSLKIEECPKLLHLVEATTSPLSSPSSALEAEELDLTSSLPNLETLQISSCENLSFLTSSSLKRLSIRKDAHLDNEALSRWLRGLTSLKSLSIYKCPAITVLSVGEAMCGLTTLERLDIRICKELTSLVGSHGALASLKSLTIETCPKLLHLVEATTSPSSSPSSAPGMHLKTFRISNANPKQITSWLRHCASLEELEIRSCPELTCFNDNDGNDAGGELEAALLNLAPSLRAFSIWHCDNLRSLPSGLRQLSSLDSLTIWSCPAIQSLPVAGLPESLKELHINGCRTLKERCEREGGADWPLIRHIPRIHVYEY